MKKILLALLILLGSVPAFATDYHVAKTGNDSNPGTLVSPFLTIGACIGGASSVAVAGDTCYLHTGTYNEAVGCTVGATGCHTGTSFSNALTLRNYSSDVVTITKTGGGVDAIFGLGVGGAYPSHLDGYWILQGLIFDGTNTAMFPIGGLYVDYVRMIDCEVKNAKNSGILPEGNGWEFLNLNVHDNGTDGQDHGLYYGSSDGLIDGGTYHDNQGLGIQILNSGGCDGSATQGKECTNDNTVRNARIYNNGLSAGGGGLFMGTGSNNISYNNLIYNNTGPGESIDSRCGLFRLVSSAGDPCGSYNDTIYGNSSYGMALGLTDANVVAPIVKNDIIYSNGSDTILDNSYMMSSDISNNLTGTDPAFVNASLGNFMLQAGSAALACGIDVHGTGITGLYTDIAGTSRPMSAAECGAYQFSNTGAVYYISMLSGNDTYDGTQKTHTTGTTGPWKHMPFMGGASSVPAGITLTGDEVIVFKGGETWVGTEDGGIFFNMTGGSSGHPITITTDHTWYTGGSWSKPKFDTEYLYSTHIALVGMGWVDINDIEVYGATFANQHTGSSGLILGSAAHHINLSNLYIHGWQFTGGTDQDGVAGGVNFGDFSNPTTETSTISLTDSEIENSENTGSGKMGGNSMRYIANITRTTIHDVSSVGTQFCNFSDGSIYNVNNGGNAGTDTNYHFNFLYVDPTALYETLCIVKNSVFYNGANGIEGLVNSLAREDLGATVRIENNILYGSTNSLGYIVLDNYSQGSTPGGTTIVSNNVIVTTDQASGGAIEAIHQTTRGYNYESIVIQNNHFIGPGTDTAYSLNCAIVDGICETHTNYPNDGTLQTAAAAAGQGYDFAHLWAPQNGSGATVGTGTDLSALFTNTYTGAARTVPWDIGPYQFVVPTVTTSSRMHMRH